MGYVIRDHHLSEDPWQYLDGDTPVPEGDIVVPLERWLNEPERFLGHRGRVGIELRTDDDIQALIPTLGYLNLVVINVPAMGDGRCFSLATLLRVRHAYNGELRARGQFLLDQLQYLQRCGFNAYELEDIGNPGEALGALETFSVFYQSAADEATPASTLRHRGRERVSKRPRRVDLAHRVNVASPLRLDDWRKQSLPPA